jgi:filamentous hemagglutinin
MSRPPLSRPQRLLGLICSFLVCLPPVGWSGDILRQGAPAGQRPDRTSALDAATAAAAARARASASDAMARTSRAISAVQAMQTAARAAAEGARNLGADPNHPGVILPDVPDGLAPGGLEVAGELPWTGAALPVQNETTVTVQQTEQQAILNWRTFNIGRNTTLAFDQSAGGEQVGTWVAFNKVNDPSGRPSQILGSITAPGQVYLINQNGIIFGGTSQVNTHTLVASSLPINDNLIANGLLNNPDGQFLFSALPLPAGAQGTPGFTPPTANTPDGRSGDVTVQAGAQLIAPTSIDKVGGRIALIGANVNNSGTISTADGQTILAAGLQVGFDAHDSNDATLRGLDVFVGAVSDPVLGEYAGRVTNDGFIEAYRGSVTMVGKSIDHLGAINSSTSVALNGRVDLLANYNSISNDTGQGPLFLPRSTGTVRLGPASVIQILPEWNSGETAVGVKLPLRSQVNIQGFAVHLGEQSTIYAPNAQVSISAGIWDFFQNVNEGRVQFLRSGGQVYVDRGAMINVAGSTDVNVALSQYILSVVLRGAELADSPVQRTGPLRGPSITVDLRKTGSFGGRRWVGTPLADLSGFVGLVERSAGQLSAEGGSVSISAGESVILQNGSIIDVSGGFANVEGGFVQTTRIMQGGRLVDIADATPDQVYDGIYTGKFNTGSARWGVTETYTVPWMTGKHYQKGYVEGAAGGAIDIKAPSMAIDGTLQGHTVVGERQREANPAHSELSLEFTAQNVLNPNARETPFNFSPTPPTVTFQPHSFQEPADPFMVDLEGNPAPLRADRKAEVFLSPELLTTYGFGNLNVENSDGDVYVPNNVALIAPAAGSITLSGKNIDVQGTLSAPAGAITLNVFNISPYLLQVTSDEPALDRGNFVLGARSSLNVAGLLIDDRFSAPFPLSQPLGVNVRDEDGEVFARSTLQGGSVAINSFNADLMPGSVIDASGGVWMTARSERNYGDGGSISIKAGKDPQRDIVGGRLLLGSELRGYSGATGGSLTLQAQIIQIGGAPTYENTLLLQPDFFSKGGFTEFTLIGIGANLTQPGDLTESYAPAVTIAPGTVIEPVAESLLAIPHVRGSDTFGLVKLVKPVGYRTPVSLNFETVEGGINSVVDGLLKVRGDIVMGEGSRILTDPMGRVSFNGQTVAILGSVTAPGGSIRVIGASSFPTLADPVEALPTVYLGPSSRLSTKGTAIYLADRFNRRTGYVLPGGTISVAGNIVADEGALLDVSGTSAEFDVHPAYLNLNATASGLLEQLVVPFNSGITMPLYHSLSVPHQVDSDGGSIRLEGGELLHTRATLRGFAGGPSAIGGKLFVSSGYFGVADDRRINLTVAQDINTLPIPVFPAGQSPIGQPLRDAAGAPIPGQGYFGVNHFINSGLDALTLDGNVEFRGPVDLPARGYLRVGLGGVIQADSEVNLSAPYVAIGRPFQTPFLPSDNRILFEGPLADGSNGPVYLNPTFGTGILNIVADQIDIGTLSLQGIGEANLYATNDIRGNGTLNIAGRLTLTAGQIYPTTASAFTLSAYDYVEGGVTKPGVVWIGSSGVNRDVPLSAGGQLNIFASVIHQGGVLRAPIGSINLGWDGQGTAPIDPLTNAAVPVSQQLTLTSGSITSVSAVNSLTGEASIIPYGLVTDGGVSWIDPAGLNITAGGVAQKSVRLSAGNLITEPGSLIDLSGGGDLLAYSFIKGNGGSTDILASEGSFAVIPGYDSNAAPYAPFNDNDVFAGDPGYVNGTLQVGDRIFLSGSDALRAGHYTLLPARYALLPGAVLVTPQEGMPIGTFKNADGSFYVSGYRYNDLNSSRNRSGLLYSRFEVASAEVFNQRAKYETFFANEFLQKSAIKADAQVPRLPQDGGYLLSNQLRVCHYWVRSTREAHNKGGPV